MKKTICICAFLLFVFSGFTQVVDTAAVRLEVDSLNRIVRKSINQRNYEQALEVNGRIENIAAKSFSQDSKEYGDVCYNFCRIFYFLAKYNESSEWGEKTLVIREKVFGKVHSEYAKALNNLGNVYRILGKDNKAEQILSEAKKIFEITVGKESVDYARSLNNLAILYYQSGKYEKAEPLYFEVLEIEEKMGGKNTADYCGSLINIATLYFTLGYYWRAEPLLLQAKNIFEIELKNQKHPFYQTCLNNLSNIYKATGNYESAVNLLYQIITLQEKQISKFHPDYARSLTNLARVYEASGKIDSVESLYLEVMLIQDSVFGKQHSEYSRTISNLGAFYTNIGKYREAETYLNEALETRINTVGENHPTYGSTMNCLGVLYYALKKYEESAECYLSAKKNYENNFGREHIDFIDNLINLSIVYCKLEKYKMAEQGFTEASVLSRSIISKALYHLSEQEILNYIAKLSKNLGHIISFSYDQYQYYPQLASVCYDNSLFYKTGLLYRYVKMQNLLGSNPEYIENYKVLKSLERSLAKEYSKPVSDRKDVSSLETNVSSLEKDLARTVAGFGDAIRQITWQEVQSTLHPNEAALEFIHFNYYNPDPTDSVLYAALLLKPGMQHPMFIPLCEEKQLKALLPTADGKLNNDQVNELYSNNELYRLLWSPLESQLAGVRKVYYSPSGLLHRLNLAALPTGTKAVLSDRHDMVPLGSTRQLSLDNQNVASNEAPTALIYGGIQFDMDSMAYPTRPANRTGGQRGLSFVQTDSTLRGDTWNFLKWSEKEADNIQTALGQAGIKAQVVKGRQATEESFKQIGQSGPSPRILHLSTHGFFFPDPASNPQSETRNLQSEEPVFKLSDHPMIRSGLILAGANYAWKTGRPLGNREDGILTAYEISQLDLRNTELVVLSACETGLGHIEGNEGVYGLQRAFKIAGAKTLVMSLWQVPDYQTQELMTVFYQKWLLGKLPVRQALQAAQKEMRDKGYEPYYWAGFVVVE